jgi:hypothetical protein
MSRSYTPLPLNAFTALAGLLYFTFYLPVCVCPFTIFSVFLVAYHCFAFKKYTGTSKFQYRVLGVLQYGVNMFSKCLLGGDSLRHIVFSF